MVDQARARKLADRIAQIVAEMLERRIKDPRLGFITVTEARLTGDLREATVFYTVYGSSEERTATAAALASATGVIRSEVGHQTGLKHTPSLTFVADTLPEGARHMEDLVARAREADARLAQVREGAVPAGDPDPYREPPGAAGDDDLDEDDPDGDGLDGDGLDGDGLDGDEPGAGDLDGDLDDPDDDDLGDQPEGTAPGTRPARDVLGGTSAAGDHGAGYSPA
jgi:ribosome-binding factor A